MKRKNRRVKLAGDNWSVRYVPSEELGGDFGECDRARYRIRIRDSLNDANRRQHLRTVIHEGIHALYQDTTEDERGELATIFLENGLADLLWAVGYRLVEEPKE